jgi:diacylglycerol kinase (ATP)
MSASPNATAPASEPARPAPHIVAVEDRPAEGSRGHGRNSFFGSFVHAYEGLLHACGQRNMKFHVVSAVLVGLVGSGIRLDLAEKVTLIFCVLLIFFAEILNTALEALVDLHTQDFRNLAKITKDAAAASVLILAFGTVVIFAALLVHKWDLISQSGPQIARQASLGIPLAAVTGFLLTKCRRPALADHALFAVGVLLWGALWQITVSWVFTTLTGLLLLLAWRAARRNPRPT